MDRRDFARAIYSPDPHAAFFGANSRAEHKDAHGETQITEVPWSHYEDRLPGAAVACRVQPDA